MTIPPDSPRPALRTRRGFAAMDPERQREIASAGGRAAHEKGSAHQFTAREARLAGLKSRALAAAASAALVSEAPQPGPRTEPHADANLTTSSTVRLL
jgi:uncharacterized protein